MLEIGSGTGQHSVHFAADLPHLRWHTSDLQVNHSGISAWINHSQLTNIEHPINLNVETYDWSNQRVEAIFSANAIHIMSWSAARVFIAGAAESLIEDGYLLLYGPYNYNGGYTSPSNANFDRWLKRQHSDSAIRDFEAVNDIATEAGLLLTDDQPMPANNRLLVWRKRNFSKLLSHV